MTDRTKTVASALIITGVGALVWTAVGPTLAPEPGYAQRRLGAIAVNPKAAYMVPWGVGLYLGGLLGLWVLHVRRAVTFRAIGAMAVGVVAFIVGLKAEYRLETMPWREALAITPSALAEPGARMPLGLWSGCAVAIGLAALMRANWRAVGDAWAVALSLTIPIGRIACLLAGCCFGKVCHHWPSLLCMTYGPGTAPFAYQVAYDGLDSGATESLPMHPLPVYFALASLVTLAVLVWMLRRGAPVGELLLVFAILRPVSKLLLEQLRGEPRPGPFMTLIPATVLSIAATVIVLRARRRVALISMGAAPPALDVDRAMPRLTT